MSAEEEVKALVDGGTAGEIPVEELERRLGALLEELERTQTEVRPQLQLGWRTPGSRGVAMRRCRRV